MASGVRNMYQSLIQGSEPGSVQAEKIPHLLLMDVLNMSSQTPANVMGLSERGSLRVGYHADFILLNDNLETQACWVGGKQVASNIRAEL
jgi:N-acetylglucosamine-6-phosphate deacetylase